MEENSTKKISVFLIVTAILFVISLIILIMVTSKAIYDTSSKSCEYNGVIYKNGESFKDDCNTCSCQNGEIGCTAMGCTGDISN